MMIVYRISSLLFGASLLALALGATAVPLAHAEDGPVGGEVMVILAKEEAGPIDAKLKQLAPLQKPPFNGFKSMTVLSTASIEINEGKNASVDLPNGGKLQLKLVQRMPDGRHKVELSIVRPGKQDAVMTVVASGETFFIAGQKYEGGTLVIGVRVGNATSPGKK